MPIIDHFGLIAPFYDRALGTHDVEHLSQLLELPAQGMMLDAAGGTGRVAHDLRYQVGRVVVVDESPEMLTQAEQKGGIQAVQGRIEQLPFGEGTFERVMMVDALHHVADQYKTLAELWRVLQPGGRLVVEELDIRKPVVKLVAVAEKLLLMRSHFLSPDSIVSMMNAIINEKRTPNSHISIDHQDHRVWIIVKK